MQITKKSSSPTQIIYTVNATAEQLDAIKQRTLREVARTIKIQGFRAGKAPLALVEKQVDQASLQTQFLDNALNTLWGELFETEKLRPVDQPDVTVNKFVPFTTLEANYEVTSVGEITLPDYKKLRVAKPTVKIEAKDVDEVLKQLLGRAATKQKVDRAAKDGYEVLIDFKGVDAKTKDAIAGADGSDYPLVIGSNSFIPGFEPELLGLKAGANKTFDITFPADYGAKELQNKKVTFTVTAKEVSERKEPKLDDAFAKTIGPFTALAELKSDIKKQLQTERETQARRDYESEVLAALAEMTKVELPKVMVETEIDRTENEERQNLTYRGQTWQEHLTEEGVTEEAHHERQREGAEARIKAGLVLSEVADREGITVSPDEVALRVELLKGQYQDPKMIAELDKPDNQRELRSRLLTEKTIQKLTDYASAAK